MADRILPIVELLLPIEDAIFDLGDEKWLLKHPITGAELPPGASFPFRLEELLIYTRLKEGVGKMPISVEMRLQESFVVDPLLGGGILAKPVRSEAIVFEFPGGNQLLSHDFVLKMTDVPFPQPGVYEFAIMVNYAQSQGLIATLRILD